MQLRASFIQVGEEYFATIKLGRHEEILQENGRNKPFASAVQAQAAAIAALSPSPCPIEQAARPAVSPEIERWKREKAKEAQRSRDAFALRKTVVVRKRRTPA